MIKYKIHLQERQTNVWMADTATQLCPPRIRIESLILHTILNCVHFLSITTFGWIPFVLFVSSACSFKELNNPDIGFQLHTGTFCTDELQTLEPGSSSHLNPHLRPRLCPASLIIRDALIDQVLETPSAWAKPQSRQIFRERNNKRQIFI